MWRLKLVVASLACAFLLSASSAVRAQGMMPNTPTAKIFVDGCRELARIEAGENEPASYSEQQVMEGIVGAGNCLGYINGFLSGYGYAGYQAAGPNVKKICIPSGVTHGQIARVLVARLNEKPEFEHLPALPYLVAILKLTWPCAR